MAKSKSRGHDEEKLRKSSRGSYSQGLVPFINAVKSKAPIKLVDIAMEYGMGGTTCVLERWRNMFLMRV